jgi:hypothetical protein
VRNQAPAYRRKAALPTRSLWQLLVAVCLLAGSFTDVWHVAHLLTVRHVACPYDGVLIHEDELPVEVRTRSDAPSARETMHASVAPAHEHDDCAGLGPVDRPCTLVTISGSSVIQARQADTALPPVATSTTRSVLSFAPKRPPPV